MEIKIKYMAKDDWKRITDKEYTTEKVIENDIKGIASLLYIKDITNPLYKTIKQDFTVNIVNKNFYWLQIGPENENYWITAMYDNNKILIQYYIDITLKNIIKYDNDSYFYDLFLDVVVLPNNDIFLLDEDELNIALQENKINENQYKLAYNQAKKTISDFKNNKSYYDNLCNKYFNILQRKIYN